MGLRKFLSKNNYTHYKAIWHIIKQFEVAFTLFSDQCNFTSTSFHDAHNKLIVIGDLIIIKKKEGLITWYPNS